MSGFLHFKDENYNLVNKVLLRDVFHQPMVLMKENNFDNLLRGHVSQSLQEFNNVYSEEMTEWLFATKDFGLDIVSLNVQRGRDHQIPGYTTYK